LCLVHRAGGVKARRRAAAAQQSDAAEKHYQLLLAAAFFLSHILFRCIAHRSAPLCESDVAVRGPAGRAGRRIVLPVRFVPNDSADPIAPLLLSMALPGALPLSLTAPGARLPIGLLTESVRALTLAALIACARVERAMRLLDGDGAK